MFVEIQKASNQRKFKIISSIIDGIHINEFSNKSDFKKGLIKE